MKACNLYYMSTCCNFEISVYVAEMGADFNILEYADPELDNLDCGNKTNILYDLDDEESNKSTHNKTVSNDKSSVEIEIKPKEEDDLQRLSSLNDRKEQNSVTQTLGIEKYEQDIIRSPKVESSGNVNSQVTKYLNNFTYVLYTFLYVILITITKVYLTTSREL